MGGFLKGIGKDVLGGVAGDAKDKVGQMAKDKAIEEAIKHLPEGSVDLAQQPDIKGLVQNGLASMGYDNVDTDQGLVDAYNSIAGAKDKIEDIAQFGPQQLAKLYDKLKDTGNLDHMRDQFTDTLKSRFQDQFNIEDLGSRVGDKVKDGIGGLFKKMSSDVTDDIPPAQPGPPVSI